MRFCRSAGIPTNVPFRELPEGQQTLVVDGEPDYGIDEEHEWPRAWYGVKGYFRWLESKAYKMHVRVLLSRYRAYVTCKTCQGARFQPEALDYRLPLPGGLTLPDFYALTVREALMTVEALRHQHVAALESALQLAFEEMEARLTYLEQVGLGYLTLDRPTRSLSGGETERVNLATCLGTRLVNTLYVLDEPSVGLHPRDTERLVRVLEQLRDLGNTVVVVEHESAVMRAANQIIDLGPGRGVDGGEVVFQGTLPQLLCSKKSLTGRYLSGAALVGGARQRSVRLPGAASLTVSGVTRHNLQDLSVELPLQRLVCVTGVSGSGKSTLVRDILHPLLRGQLCPGESAPVSDAPDEEQDDSGEADSTPAAASLEGWEKLDEVVLVDQSAIGRTPRSNPAVYVGAFDAIRALFAASDEAKRRGLAAGGFSFNSQAGQCPRCRGAGFEKIEMQFLSDVFVRCPECDGKRYRPHVLEVMVTPPGSTVAEGWSISRFLEATVDEAVEFLGRFEEKSAARAAAALGWLREVGLGYLQLGQPVNTLSGGECQRLKLVGALAESSAKGKGKTQQCHRLYLLDEPTTGLHFDDVRVLLEALQRLVDLGHSVIVIEHNLDVIRAADWVVDLGPEAGDGGGKIVFEGTPGELEKHPDSHTAAALRGETGSRPKTITPVRKRKV
jgi:excinuclease ABC subunit A